VSEIRLEQVAKVYPGGVRAVDGVSLTIGSGEFMVLVGPSGCGKSTLLRMLAGLEEVSEGEIWIGDREVARLAPRDRDVAMVFQNYALYPHLSVEKNLAYGLKVRNTPKDEIARRVDEVARMLGLEELRRRRPGALSGGQRQRVAIARALLIDPRILILDDATASVDATTEALIREGLREAMRERTTIIIAHRLSTIALADEVVVLEHGRIAARGTQAELLRTSGVFQELHEHGLLQRLEATG
jgi:ABC-type sugar transport system ATPase subunit